MEIICGPEIRTVEEIMKQATINVIHNAVLKSQASHSEEINPVESKKSIGKKKYLKRMRRRNR